jgi:hypothetical protein
MRNRDKALLGGGVAANPALIGRASSLGYHVSVQVFDKH